MALRCAEADVPGLIRGIARAGGGGNVTIPHKSVAARSIERATDAVIATDACNTFWAEDGVVCGDNTDVAGISEAVRALLGRDARGARVLLLGGGGSARAAAYALVRDGADRLVVLNRTRARGEELRDRLDQDGRISVVTSTDELRGQHFDLAVNATSLGLKTTDPLPLSEDAPVTIDAALDLVYSPTGTPWVRALQARGIQAADGREMLLQQGAASFRLWWRMEPPVEAMRSALFLPTAG